MSRAVTSMLNLTGSMCRTSAVAVFLLCGAVAFDPAVPGDLISGAVAQDEKPKKDKRETRRTPALRNKVYEKLAEAQTLAEAKDYAGAGTILSEMIAEDGKRALNSYELARGGHSRSNGVNYGGKI